MKSLYISIVLILAVIIFLGVNFFINDSFLKKTEALLLALPENPEELEEFSGTEVILKQIDAMWKEREVYCRISLEHKMRCDFYEELITAIVNSREEKYDELALSLALMKDRLTYIRFNESTAFANVM